MNLKLYLILGTILVSLVGANVWYIRHLQNTNHTLSQNNVRLEESLHASEASRTELERRNNVEGMVTRHFDDIRRENHSRAETQRQGINKSVQEDLDRRVGPLLERLFNEAR